MSRGLAGLFDIAEVDTLCVHTVRIAICETLNFCAVCGHVFMEPTDYGIRVSSVAIARSNLKGEVLK